MSLEIREEFRAKVQTLDLSAYLKPRELMKLPSDCREKNSPRTKFWDTPVFRCQGDKEGTQRERKKQKNVMAYMSSEESNSIGSCDQGYMLLIDKMRLGCGFNNRRIIVRL